MASRTLNQIRAEIVDFAKDHGQLWTVKFGRQAELPSGGSNTKFPAFYYDLQNVRKQGPVQQFTFQAWLVDKLLDDLSNVEEIYSDAVLIASDILGFLDGDDRDFELQDGVTMSPMFDVSGDRLAGVSFSFTLIIAHPFDRCIVPLKPRGYLLTEAGEILGDESGDPFLQETADALGAEAGYAISTENNEIILL